MLCVHCADTTQENIILVIFMHGFSNKIAIFINFPKPNRNIDTFISFSPFLSISFGLFVALVHIVFTCNDSFMSMYDLFEFVFKETLISSESFPELAYDKALQVSVCILFHFWKCAPLKQYLLEFNEKGFASSSAQSKWFHPKVRLKNRLCWN